MRLERRNRDQIAQGPRDMFWNRASSALQGHNVEGRVYGEKGRNMETYKSFLQQQSMRGMVIAG